MSFLLDTDVCSAHLRGRREVVSRVQQRTGGLSISVITLGELYVLALRRKSSRRYLPGIQELAADLRIVDIDPEVARTFGELRAQLLDMGRPMPIPDLWIAATALTHSLTLVTHNTSDFAAIPGLQFEDWLAS